jgi:2-amino-4-hydroxy-6-hydroxymethyldihydropteridine diphosphokinase
VTGYLGLGSNQGDRRSNLRRALDALATHNIQIEAVSGLYETPPMYVAEQPLFLNAAVRIGSKTTNDDLLNRLQEVEEGLGRQHGQRYGPRPIDLDVLLLGRDGHVVIDSEHLVVPHPRLEERAFVLLPLAEIAADLVHPISRQSVRSLAERSSHDSGARRLSGPEWYEGS